MKLQIIILIIKLTLVVTDVILINVRIVQDIYYDQYLRDCNFSEFKLKEYFTIYKKNKFAYCPWYEGDDIRFHSMFILLVF